MTTTVVEPQQPQAVVEPFVGAHVEVADKRTILANEEFRCKRPTRVSEGLDAVMQPCGAESWYYVTYPGGADRYYCAHHAKAEWDTILRVAISVRDESKFINKAPSVSS